MAKKRDLESEDKILEAAKEVFHSRGFFGTRMQEIADKAGINKAMLHYYFRSKDKLFEAIFREAMARLSDQLVVLLNEDMPLEKKISNFVEKYTNIFFDHAYLPGFILHEINHNFERLKFIFDQNDDLQPMVFALQIKNEMEDGKIVKVDPRHIIVNILALCIFPFAAKPLLQHKMNFTENEYMDFLRERQKVLPEMILNGIKKS